jgi:hypothetical protein
MDEFMLAQQQQQQQQFILSQQAQLQHLMQQQQRSGMQNIQMTQLRQQQYNNGMQMNQFYQPAYTGPQNIYDGQGYGVSNSPQYVMANIPNPNSIQDGAIHVSNVNGRVSNANNGVGYVNNGTGAGYVPPAMANGHQGVLPQPPATNGSFVNVSTGSNAPFTGGLVTHRVHQSSVVTNAQVPSHPMVNSGMNNSPREAPVFYQNQNGYVQPLSPQNVGQTIPNRSYQHRNTNIEPSNQPKSTNSSYHMRNQGTGRPPPK